MEGKEWKFFANGVGGQAWWREDEWSIGFYKGSDGKLKEDFLYRYGGYITRRVRMSDRT